MTDECAAVIKMVHDLCIYVPFSLVSLLGWLGSFDVNSSSVGLSSRFYNLYWPVRHFDFAVVPSEHCKPATPDPEEVLGF